MKKGIFTLFLLSSTLFSEIQHQILTTYGVITRECPTCERIYSLRNQLGYLNDYRLRFIKRVQEWLQKQPISLKQKTIQSYLNDIQDFSDKIVSQLAHNAKVDTYLDNIQKLIKQIDPYLPMEIKFDENNYYENMKEIFDIDNYLKTLGLPDTYNLWLKKRINLPRQNVLTPL